MLGAPWQKSTPGESRVRREHVNANQVYVIVSNHQSFADIPVISHLKLDTKWLGKAEVWRLPILNWMLRWAGDVPIDRDSRARARKHVQCAPILAPGMFGGFLPRRNRVTDGRVLPFNEAFHLAIRERVPILPLVVEAPERLCHETPGFLERPRTSTFGSWSPFPSPAGTSNKFPRCAMRVRQRIVDELERLRGH